MKLLSFGEVLFDIYSDRRFIGGAPFNLAAHAALQGAEAYLLSAVGEDSLGEEVLEQSESLGIHTDYLQKRSDKETGKCLVTLDEHSVPTYQLLPDMAYDYITCPTFEPGSHFDVFAFGTLALRQENNRHTVIQLLEKRLFSDIFTDLNIRPPFYSEQTILFCLENATILKISEEELPIVTEAVFGKALSVDTAPVRLAQQFPQLRCIIITCGANGSLALDCHSLQTFRCAAKSVKVISTVGAGDSFSATYLTHFLQGEPIGLCLAAATEISAKVIAETAAVPLTIYETVGRLPNSGTGIHSRHAAAR